MTNQEFNWAVIIDKDCYVFHFSFHSLYGWRIYLLSYPFSRARSENNSQYHILIDGFGRRYVSWDGYIDNGKEAIDVAKRWAKLYQRYVYFGTPFSKNPPQEDRS
jgi:hypothetical protein